MNTLSSTIGVASLMICFMAVNIIALASEEEFTRWQSVSVRSQKLPEAGVVSVDAVETKDGYQRFAIRAFGRSYSLSSEDLKRLADCPLSSLSLRHTAGYPRVGGFTVLVRLERTYYDQQAKKAVREAIYVSIRKNAKLSISGPNAIAN